MAGPEGYSAELLCFKLYGPDSREKFALGLTYSDLDYGNVRTIQDIAKKHFYAMLDDLSALGDAKLAAIAEAEKAAKK